MWLSSSMSVFEKQELRYLLQDSPRSAGAGIREGPLSALFSRSPGQRLSYCLTTKSMPTRHNRGDDPYKIATDCSTGRQ